MATHRHSPAVSAVAREGASCRGLQSRVHRGPAPEAGAPRGAAARRRRRPAAGDAPAPLLFLSHAGGDDDAARDLAHRLRQAGIDVWLDLDELRPGDRWMGSMENALERADAFAVYVGRSGIRDWVDREVRLALVRNTAEPEFRVIPILGAGATPESLPRFLAQHQWLDLRSGHKDPAELQRLVGAILERSPESVSVISPDETPFRGLRPFEVKHAHLFFGRDREVGELLELLGADPFLAVIGSSGSGKSSLVKAGLLPALAHGRFHDGKGWVSDFRTAVLRPGDDPFRELANALCDLDPKLDPEADPVRRLEVRDACARRLETGTDGLYACVAGLVNPGARTLLVIDQFEELFTLTESPDERRRFIDSLLAAVDAEGDRPIHCLITLRADFFSECWQHPELPKRISANQMAVRRMDLDQLRETIEEPARMGGVLIEPGLAEAILHDAGDEPGNLALLQHALFELWERRTENCLSHASYEAIGRLQGALEHRADAVYARLDDEEKQLARRVFLCLTEPGKATEATRRRVRREKFETLGGFHASLEETLNRLVDQRLLTVGTDRDGEEHVEVAHEALIRGWRRLKGWLEEDREFLLWRKRLQTSLEAWNESGHDHGALLRGAALAEAYRWRVERQSDLDGVERAFIEASLHRRRRFHRLRAAVVATVAMLAVVAALAAAVATVARGEAERRREQAETSLGLAREAVDTMLVEVPHEALADVPQMEELRKGLLEKARSFYQQFLEQKPTDPDLRLEAAVTRQQVGDVDRLLGRTDRAERAYLDAAGQLQGLLADRTGHPPTRRALADVLNQLGELLRESGRVREAIPHYTRALNLHWHLDTGPEDRQRMARSHYNRGLARMQLLDPASAETDLLRAIELLEPLAGSFPAERTYRQELARSYNNLGKLLNESNRPREAEARYRQSIAVYGALAVEDPDRREYRLEVARTCNNLGHLLATLGELESAELLNREALELLEELAAPVPELSNVLANSYNSRGGILQLTERPVEAEQAHRRAAEIFERLVEQYPDRPHHACRLGKTLINVGWLRLGAGDFSGAAAVAERIERLLPEIPESQRDQLEQEYLNLASYL